MNRSRLELSLAVFALLALANGLRWASTLEPGPELAESPGQWRAVAGLFQGSTPGQQAAARLLLFQSDPSQLRLQKNPLAELGALPPDAAAGAWVAGISGESSLWVGGSSAKPHWSIHLKQPQAAPAVAPLAAKIAFIDLGRLWLTDREGLTLRSVLELPKGSVVSHLTWSQDQSSIYWQDQHGWRQLSLRAPDVR